MIAFEYQVENDAGELDVCVLLPHIKLVVVFRGPGLGSIPELRLVFRGLIHEPAKDMKRAKGNSLKEQ